MALLRDEVLVPPGGRGGATTAMLGSGRRNLPPHAPSRCPAQETRTQLTRAFLTLPAPILAAGPGDVAVTDAIGRSGVADNVAIFRGSLHLG